jgi:hypothetical protein
MVQWTRAVAIFTFFLVLASAVSDWFIYRQYKVANDAQFDTREQLRAVVTFQLMNEFIQADKDGKILSYAFQPQFFNSGGTRAAKFIPWGSVKYFDGDIPNSLDLTKPWFKIDLVESVIGANSTGAIQPVTLNPEEASNVSDKKGAVLIWGQATYVDIFQPENAHLISYCYKLISVQSTEGKLVLQPVAYKPECNYSK